MFKGTYRHKIDPKGRVPVPAAFRESVGTDAVPDLLGIFLQEIRLSRRRLRFKPPSAAIGGLAGTHVSFRAQAGRLRWRLGGRRLREEVPRLPL